MKKVCTIPIFSCKIMIGTCVTKNPRTLVEETVRSTIDLFHMVIFNFGGFVFFPRGGSLILDRFWAYLTEHCKGPYEKFSKNNLYWLNML
jgi:hypothetical protein